MRPFEVGDRVRLRKSCKEFKWKRGGVSYAVTGLVERIVGECIKIDFPDRVEASLWSGLESEIALVKRGKEMRDEAKDSTEWSFHSASNLDIDYIDILEAMSHKNPIALITRGDKFKVAIRRSLIKKAEVCGLPMPSEAWVHRTERGQVISCKGQADFAVWIAWAKVVRKATWPKNYRQPCTVTIVTPTI